MNVCFWYNQFIEMIKVDEKMKNLNIKKINATCNTCGESNNIVSIAIGVYVSVIHCADCNNISGDILFTSGSNCGRELDIEFLTEADKNSNITVNDVILLNDNICDSEKSLVKEIAVEMVNSEDITNYRMQYMEKAA
jgi:hypothetical protein